MQVSPVLRAFHARRAEMASFVTSLQVGWGCFGLGVAAAAAALPWRLGLRGACWPVQQACQEANAR